MTAGGFTPLIRFAVLLYLIWTTQNVDGSCSGSMPNGTKLNVFPGEGWDSLTGTAKDRILRVTYEQCRTTPDGYYLIPDGVQATRVKSTEIQLYADVYDGLNDFVPATARSFYSGSGKNDKNLFGGLASIDGTFSEEFVRVKKLLASQNATLTRIQLHGTAYVLRLDPSFSVPLNDGLLKRLKEAGELFRGGNRPAGRYLLERIVDDYGTHYTTVVNAGAMLIEQNLVRREFVRKTDRNKVSAAASYEFLKMVNFRADDVMASISPSILESYKEARVYTEVKSVGTVFNNGETVQQWLTGIRRPSSAEESTVVKDFAVIDRQGLPLYELLVPGVLPELTFQDVETLRDELKSVIGTYYLYNTHKGCTDFSSPRFDFTANVDDGSCDYGISAHYGFGGFFQTCHSNSSKANSTDSDNPCHGLNQINLLTNEFSCRTGDRRQLLLDYSDTVRSKRVCDKNGKCRDEFYAISISWCWFYRNNNDGNPRSNPKNSSNYDAGIHYGGLFSSVLSNPFTGSRSCPHPYAEARLGFDVTVCLVHPLTPFGDSPLDFGGFFSCENGNPETSMFPDFLLKECDKGYSEHTVTVVNGDCYVKNCYNSSAFRANVQFPLVRPSSMDPEAFVADEGGSDSGDGAEENGSLWMTLAIVFGVAFVLVLVAVAVIFVRARARSNPNRNPYGYERVSSNDEEPILNPEKQGPATYQSLPGGPRTSEENV